MFRILSFLLNGIPKSSWYLTDNTIRPQCWVRQLMFNKEIIILFPENHTKRSNEWKMYDIIQMAFVVIIAVS